MIDFIAEFLEYNKSYESPTEFFLWSALTGVAAVMRDNCYILLGDTRIYPNIYTLIIGKPAMRKAKPLNSIIELVKSCDSTKVIEGRTSVQAVIQRLGDIERLKSGKTITGASGIIYSEEISAMFTDDEANIPVLTDLYDYKSSYTSSLVSRGTTRLTNVVVTVLGASNEELLKPIFNSRAIYGGLLSRCLIVYGDKVRHRNSLMYEVASQYDPAALKQIIYDISRLKGIFTMTPEARDYYNEWYLNVCPELEKKANRTGADGRIHITALKVSMLLAVSRYRELKIDIPVIETAIDYCQSLFVNYKRLTLGAGKGKDSEIKTLFLRLLWDSGPIKGYKLTRREVVSKSWGDMNSEELDSIVRNLSEGGLIHMFTDTKIGESYSLTEFSVKYFSEGA